VAGWLPAMPHPATPAAVPAVMSAGLAAVLRAML
jgi:hypothetical protein